MIYVLLALPGADHEDSPQPFVILASIDKEKLQIKADELIEKEILIQTACHELSNYCQVIHELPPPLFSMTRAEYEKKAMELDEQFDYNMAVKQKELAQKIGVPKQTISAWRLPITYEIEEVETI